jgi:phage FluMu protein Com
VSVLFNTKELKCSICNKQIEKGEEISVVLKMPGFANMPYGMLDASLAKHAEEVRCEKCKIVNNDK